MENTKKKPQVRFKGFTDDWEQCRLGNVIKDISDGPFGSNLKIEHYTKKREVRIIQLSNIGSDGWVDENKKYTTFEHSKTIARSIVKPGEVVIAKMMPVGQTIECPSHEKLYILSSDAVRVVLDPKFINKTYFLATTKSKSFIDKLEKESQGSTRTRTSISKIKKLKIDYPKIQEQEKIGKYFETLDKTIVLYQRKIEKLKLFIESSKNMFPKTGEFYLRIRFEKFTDAWKKGKLGSYGEFYYGKSAPKWSVSKNAPTPCVRYGELYTKFGNKIEKVISYTNIPRKNLRFSNGTEVLIPRVGEDPYDYNHCTWLSLKNVAIGEMISVYNTKQIPLFTTVMFNMTLKNEFAKRVEGGSVTNLYYEKLKNIDISFPSLEEQNKIARYFELLEKTIDLYERKLEKLKIMKKSCLEKMFV